MQPSSLICLCAFVVGVLGKSRFTQPPANGPDGNYQDNPVYALGKQVDVQWQSDLDTMDLILFEQYPAAGKGVQYLKKLRRWCPPSGRVHYTPTNRVYRRFKVDQSHLDSQSRRTKSQCDQGRRRGALFRGPSRRNPKQRRHESLLQCYAAGYNDFCDRNAYRINNDHDDKLHDECPYEHPYEHDNHRARELGCKFGVVEWSGGRYCGRVHPRWDISARWNRIAGMEEVSKGEGRVIG